MAAQLSKRELYLQVAKLHVANIDQGFLSTLGTRFVALLYRAIDECDSSAIFCEESDGRVVSFVSGATGMRPIYKRMLRYWPSLFVALLPSMINPNRMRRIIEILRYSRTQPEQVDWPAAELLSIAVDPAYRGQHKADVLYRRLAAYFSENGETAFKITVGKTLAPAHSFYRRMGAMPVADIQVHKGEDSTLYVHHLHKSRRS